MHEVTQDMFSVMALTLVILRVAGVFMVAPVFANSAVPVKLRVFMGLAIGLAIAAGVCRPAVVPTGLVDLAVAAVGEILIGAAIGYAARLVFVGVQLGAAHVGRQMGLDLGEAFNPTAEAAAGPVGRLFYMLAIVVFLAIGGHRDLISGLLQSFDLVPPLAGFSSASAALGAITALLGAGFLLAVKLAAPVVIAMLVATAALGLLQRVMPQCNIISTGLPVRVILGLLALAGALVTLRYLLAAATAVTAEKIPELFAALSGPT